MASRCGRYVLTFNGEIYNFRELRAELEACGASFRGHSDTEVLLEAVSRWSLPKALERANGMFALGLWDRELRELTLARDRLGEKPLYYGRVGVTWSSARGRRCCEPPRLRAAAGPGRALAADAPVVRPGAAHGLAGRAQAAGRPPAARAGRSRRAPGQRGLLVGGGRRPAGDGGAVRGEGPRGDRPARRAAAGRRGHPAGGRRPAGRLPVGRRGLEPGHRAGAAGQCRTAADVDRRRHGGRRRRRRAAGRRRRGGAPRDRARGGAAVGGGRARRRRAPARGLGRAVRRPVAGADGDAVRGRSGPGHRLPVGGRWRRGVRRLQPLRPR